MKLDAMLTRIPLFTSSGVGTIIYKHTPGVISNDWDVYSTGLKTYGITPGYPGIVFNPIGTINRGEIAGQLINTFNFIEAHK